MAKHRNPVCTEEFRKEAVRLASLPGRKAVAVAKGLGISAQYRARYSSVRIAEELNEAGYACCVNYVADIMREKGIRARNGKGFKYSKDVADRKSVV